MLHERDEPDAVINLPQADTLTGEHGGDVDFLPVHAEPAAGGDQGVVIVERVVDVGQAAERSG